MLLEAATLCGLKVFFSGFNKRWFIIFNDMRFSVVNNLLNKLASYIIFLMYIFIC